MGVSWQKINKENCIGRKYIDKSVFKYGIHIPIEYRDGFINNIKDESIELGKCQHIDLIFDDYIATVELRNINSKSRSETIQIRYDGNKEFKQYLKEKFKYTYDLINDEDNNIDTDEYIDIYKGQELNKFYIEYNNHDNSNSGEKDRVNSSEIKGNIDEYMDLKSLAESYDKSYKVDNSKVDKLRQEFIDKFPLKSLETLELERYALGKKEDNLCWWLEYKTIPLGSIKGGTSKKYKIYFNKENKWIYPNTFDSVEQAWLELRRSICNFLNKFKNGEYNNLNDGSLVSSMNMFKTKLLYMYFPDKLLPIYSIAHLQKILIDFGYDHKLINRLDIVQANMELKKLQMESDIFKDWDSLKFIRFIYMYVISKNKEEIEDEIILETFDVSSTVEIIYNYIQNQGYIYTKEQLSNLFLSLKTKPFVILAGISGTGKSKIVRLFSEAIGATTENKQFNMISVRPDWNDGTELMGYKNLNDDFIDGSLTKIIKAASKPENKNKPYFACLDEMNLARVEYYLSDYLSIIESRKKVGQDIITDSELQIPDNIYLIGTVNMDDTTFTFSRKVLDRANTIEFSDVNLENLFEEITEEEITPIKVDNRFLKTTYLKTMDIEEEYREYAKEINKKIIEINNILKQSQKQFAYRVRDEILFYMIENKKSELLNEDVAFDYQIMQKILPAITGSEQSIAQVLIDLFNFTCEGKVIDDIDIEEAQKHVESAKYKKSAEKIVYMLKGYQNDGYISYWY
ncbi:McrB family protein [Paraclostridium sordellii]|uniref:McrB family protein n=1 Tax=Paraclostridium sordellii TaxID=1505 RepID=UPI001F05C062|nr:AAA family ATPase [Paeniclostridium sordellii]MCH1965714.1 AAA family ATPase [Paeniclostridium sordellii]